MERVLLVALLGLAACAHRPRGPDGVPLWFEVESEHFVLRTVTDEATARATALRLERLRQALLAGSWHTRTQHDGKVQVVLVDPVTLDAALSEWGNGVASADGLGQLLVFAGTERDLSDLVVLKHELAHTISRQFLLRRPTWLEEGLATYLETLKLEDTSATVGIADAHSRAVVREVGPDTGWLLAAGREVYEAELSVRERFYARAWLLVHFLANRHLAEFEAFLTRLARSEDPRTAWTACCGALTPRLLDEEAADYVRGAAYTSLGVPLPPIAPSLQVRTLRPAEARASLAQLHGLARGWSDEARTRAVRLAREALALDGADPLAALTLCDLLGYQAPDCLQAARAAALEHPEDPRPLLLLTLALPRDQRQEREQAAERAVALAPEHPLALEALANLRLAQGRPLEALEAARRAARNAPGQAAPLVAMARAKGVLGECADALSLEERALELLPERDPGGLAPGIRERSGRLRNECRERPQSEEAVVPSRLLGCAGAGPRVPARAMGPEARVVRFKYWVREDGAVTGATAPAGAPPGVEEAVRDYLRGCRHAPATRGGKAVAVEVEESFMVPARPDPGPALAPR